MTKHIVVGYDGTAGSRMAVDWAAAEASLLEVPLRIVTCFQIPPLGEAIYGCPEAVSALRDAAQADADLALISVRREHPDLRAAACAVLGPARSALLDGLGHDDLVAVGASEHAHTAAFWLGSTPRALVRKSSCPVAVVRRHDPIGRFGSLVVGVDGSPAARAALFWAGDEAHRRNAPLEVVHAWQHPYPSTEVAGMRARQLIETDAAVVLDRELEFARDRLSCPISGRLVEASTAAALLQDPQEHALVVVGSRGAGALRSAIFGSTANAVLEHAQLPVVVVPST